MKSKWCCRKWLAARPARGLGLALALALLAAAGSVRADVPEWLRAAAQAPLPAHAPDTDAVVLLDEQITLVKERGDIKTVYRRVVKILRPGGREEGTVRVYFDKETRLTYLKAWSLPAQGKPYEVKEKDAIETSPFSGALYEDTRSKVLQIPAAEPGNIVGYEYEQYDRPFLLQDRWFFQGPYPVGRARFALQLPAGWEFETVWMNHPGQEAQAAGENRWVWEFENLPAVEDEPAMPPWRAVAGWLAVTFFPTREKLQEKSHATWRDVGAWYAALADKRREATPAIREKVAALTEGAGDVVEKLRRLAAFAQRDVRYVAIEIGIGGYQPHAAADVLANRYGDCKDKATLLSAMLREIGIESYYVLVHTTRGAVAPQFPSMLNFNHAILALRLPAELAPENLHAVRAYESYGRLLFFDPTDAITPLGYLPASLQANHGLLVTESGGELIELPLLRANLNRLLRTGKLALNSDGTLFGTVQEILWGDFATRRRGLLLETAPAERNKTLERFLANFLPGFVVQELEVENLEQYEQNLVVRYRFIAHNYAKKAGNLLLVRPRVVGAKGSDVLETGEKKERKYPVEFDTASLESDLFEIVLPGGFQVEEVPPGVTAEADFASYHSQTQAAGGVLRYQRTYEVKALRVPAARLEELKKLFRQIDADERNSAVLKRALP